MPVKKFQYLGAGMFSPVYSSLHLGVQDLSAFRSSLRICKANLYKRTQPSPMNGENWMIQYLQILLYHRPALSTLELGPPNKGKHALRVCSTDNVAAQQTE